MMQTASIQGSGSTRGWVGTLLLLPLCGYYAVKGGEVTILESTSMLLNTLGHHVAAPLGPAGAMAGGIAFQFLVPLALVIFFLRRQYGFGVQVFLFWLGQTSIFLSLTASGEVATFRQGTAAWHHLLAPLDVPLAHVAIGLFFLGMACFLAATLTPLWLARDE